VRHRLNVGRSPYGVTPARDFGAYSVTFDGKALGIGETLEPAPGVTLTRRC
jgi:CRISPR-associated protein Csd2